MTWERAALLMGGFIIGVGFTICVGLIFSWKQKRELAKEVSSPFGDRK